jgi:hypothetical protein
MGRGGFRFVFLFTAVAGLPLSIVMAIDREWLVAVGMLAGGVLSAMIYVWMPGMLLLDESGLEIQRRRGSQRLRWADIDRASWSRPVDRGIAGLIAAHAIDNWVVTLKGRRADGKETTVTLSGLMVERQQEVRQLLAARFPPPR